MVKLELDTSLETDEKNLFKRFVYIYEATYFNISKRLSKSQIEFLWALYQCTLELNEAPSYESEEALNIFARFGYDKDSLYSIVHRTKPTNMINVVNKHIVIAPHILKFDPGGFEINLEIIKK